MILVKFVSTELSKYVLILSSTSSFLVEMGKRLTILSISLITSLSTIAVVLKICGNTPYTNFACLSV